MINVLYSGNSKVFDGVLTSALSILKRTKTTEPFTFYILSMNLTRLKPEYTIIDKNMIEFFDKVIKEYNPENKVECIDVSDDFNREFLNSPNESCYCSPYTLLRLLADLLPNIPDKLLYLDVDILLNRDICELYNQNIEGYEYAAARDHYGKFLINPNYINAGVIIINLDAIRNNNLFDKMIELSKLDLPVQDQDVLNVSCYNHIRILSPIYNSMPHLFYYRKKRLSKLYSLNEIDEAISNPIIIHYADKYKPWKYYNVNNSGKWYYYYEELYNDKLKNLKNAKIEKKLDYFKKKIDMITKK